MQDSYLLMAKDVAEGVCRSSQHDWQGNGHTCNSAYNKLVNTFSNTYAQQKSQRMSKKAITKLTVFDHNVG
jgi:hypothetical protein